MDEDYYSLQSILADNHVCYFHTSKVCDLLQKLSCTFTLDVPGLGYLEGGSDQDVSRHAG